MRGLHKYVVSDQSQKGRVKIILESSRLEFLAKFSVSRFALSDTEGIISWPGNREGISDLPFLRTISNSKTRRAKFLGSDRFFCFISINLFRSFKNHFDHQPVRTSLQMQKIYSVDTNERIGFCGVWQKQKQLKTTEMSEA